jgi:hypothetical protein
MKRLLIVLAAMCLMLASCTKAKTDYEGEIKPITPGESGFKEAILIKEAGYEISILTEPKFRFCQYLLMQKGVNFLVHIYII